MKYILIFLANLDYSVKCDDIIEYTTESYGKDARMIPDDYIELIKYWTGRQYHKFIDLQTYPDNWGCHKMEIVSFFYNNRYCELSEMFGIENNHLSIRIYPSS